MSRTGIREVRCLAAEAPTAFCAGSLRPRILVSEGLVSRLGPDELDAVLLDERGHVLTFEPLIRAAHEAAAEVFFYMPLVRWWSRRRLEDSELRADRVALERLGTRPVAAALWRLAGARRCGVPPRSAAWRSSGLPRFLAILYQPGHPGWRWSRSQAWAPTWLSRSLHAWCRQLATLFR